MNATRRFFQRYFLSPLWRFVRRFFWLFGFRSFILYMIRPHVDIARRVDCIDEVVAVSRYTRDDVSIELIYTDLLGIEEHDYGHGLINALSASDLTLERAYVDGDDVAHIFLSGTLVSDDICSPSRIKAQLERPAYHVASGSGMVRAVEVLVNDRPIDDILPAE